MPHMAITMYPGRSREIKEELAGRMKQAMAEALQVDPKVVSVSIEDIPQEQWQEHLERIPDELMFRRPGEE